jgi:fructose transport system substrate-binding protein
MASSIVAVSQATAGATVKQVKVLLLLKDFINPYWIFMAKAAEADAAKLGILLQVEAGSSDSDTSSQITAIDEAIAAGDQGIIIAPNGPAVDNALAQAKKLGIYILAVDTVPTPASIVQLTFATNNTEAGLLVGKYAAARLDGKAAVIAVLDDVTSEVVSVDVDRDHGFLEGMGIPVGKPDINGFEPKSGHYTGGKGGTYQIACQLPSFGSNTGGQTAMETCLSKNPAINLVYTINEPSAQGAYKALADAGKGKGVIVVTIDGGCTNLPYVSSGEISARPRHPGHQQPRQDGRQAEAHSGPELLQHRHGGLHKHPDARRAEHQHDPSPEDVLGLTRSRDVTPTTARPTSKS